MNGYQIFNNFFSCLDEKDKIKILEGIFSIQNFSLYSISVRDNKLLFRIYSNNIFYQFAFVFDENNDKKAFFKSIGPRFVQYTIYPFYYLDSFGYPYSSFVKVLLSSDEDVINNFIRSFL